jgi:hypothetical protein
MHISTAFNALVLVNLRKGKIRMAAGCEQNVLGGEQNFVQVQGGLFA